MGGRGSSSGGGGRSVDKTAINTKARNASKLRNMTPDQLEEFEENYYLSGKEFRASHTPNQAYDAALDRYKKSGGERTGDWAAAKGMMMINRDIKERDLRQYSIRHEELRQEYISLLPKNSAGKFGRETIDLMPVSNKTLERKIRALKESKKKKKG